MDVEAPVLGPELVAAALAGCEVHEFLGVGRFGETYRVVRGGDELALKVCHFVPRMPQSLWERELTALQRVDHPNIMRLYRAGHLELAGRTCPYMECEYIPGGDLGQRIATGALPRSREELRALLVGLLWGVKELHDLGVLHRDVRPPNVVPRGGDWGRPVLLDFGVAQTMYISPAQQRLSLASRRQDLRDVAALIYEVGTGIPALPPDRRPGGDRWQDRLRRRVPRDPRHCSELFDDDVALLVHRLLAGKERRLGADEALRRLGVD